MIQIVSLCMSIHVVISILPLEKEELYRSNVFFVII